MYGITRGEANNNPCNIRKSGSPWIGKIIPSQDPDFEQFDTALDGLRAGAKLIYNYYKSGLVTITKIINKWAPPSDDNPTSSYIDNVCKYVGCQPDDDLTPLDTSTLAKIITGIVDQENGRVNYSNAAIVVAVNRALGLDTES